MDTSTHAVADHEGPEPSGASRRAVLVGAGAVAVATLAGCSTYGDDPPPPPQGNGSQGNGSPSGNDTGGEEQPPAPLAQTSDIPVGGGKVFEQQQVVVTQPTEGTFVAFSAVCTHQGCLVRDFRNDVVVCPCHQSEFRIADGSVVPGSQARTNLREVGIKVDGTQINLA